MLPLRSKCVGLLGDSVRLRHPALYVTQLSLKLRCPFRSALLLLFLLLYAAKTFSLLLVTFLDLQLLWYHVKISECYTYVEIYC